MGLRNARLSFRQQEYTHIMENIIYNELRSRAYSVDVGVVENASRLCCFLSTTPSAKLCVLPKVNLDFFRKAYKVV